MVVENGNIDKFRIIPDLSFIIKIIKRLSYALW